MNNAYPLNLPTLSTDLENKLLEFAYKFKSEITAEGYNPENDFGSIDAVKADHYQKSTNMPRGYYRAVELPADLTRAIKKEINNPALSKINLYMQIMYADEGTPEFSLAPHIDFGRRVGFVYNLIEDAVKTNFHKLLINDKTRYAFSLEEISEPIETYSFKTHKWYVMNNTVPHSITNVTKTRIAITSNVPMDYANFCKRFSTILIRD
jgi:hypothetical protein